MLHVILVLAAIGVAMYLINKYLPIEEPWKTIVNLFAILGTIVYLFNLIPGGGP